MSHLQSHKESSGVSDLIAVSKSDLKAPGATLTYTCHKSASKLSDLTMPAYFACMERELAKQPANSGRLPMPFPHIGLKTAKGKSRKKHAFKVSNGN
ncbi:unnamed protein product [Protopolystoma xenopodis]|uniref:Uncharacterized protein n=1 Tax=Protopolystoma xenopodis TaxID=117903 RepID=A0A448X520_9PLAT|nr:unnamed protein product [Protopolystoma xenopodis]